MGKFKKKLIVLGSIGIVIAGSLTYSLLNKITGSESDQNRKEMIAMYVQDEEGNYQISSSKEFPKNGYFLNLEKSTCKNGGILSQEDDTKKVKVKLAHSDQCTLYFDKETPTLKLFYDTVNKKTTSPNFAEMASTDETADGLFAMEDNYGTSYYFRGAVENNYLKFGKDTSGQDMWWRIIRFNGDGSVRILYDGTKAYPNGEFNRDRFLSTQRWNTKMNDAKYVGWMFGGANGSASTSKEEAQRNETNSEIKTATDNWYKTNIVDTGYSDYVADKIFCNDRSTPGKNETGLSVDTGLGYGNNATGYGAIAREGFSGTTNYESPKPTFVCPQENDKFTVSAENGGNGNSTYPVGLITADEIVAAGSGKYNTANSSYYLAKGSMYWSFSPSYIDTSGVAVVSNVGSSGNLSKNSVHNSGAVAPVINLKPEYLNQLKGTGKANDPYYLP